MSTRLTPKLFAERSQMIDPLNSGSTVAYVIRRSKYRRLLGDVQLTSCEKMIHWDLDEGHALAKLDAAIQVLAECRHLWVELEAKLPKRGRRRKK